MLGDLSTPTIILCRVQDRNSGTSATMAIERDSILSPYTVVLSPNVLSCTSRVHPTHWQSGCGSLDNLEVSGLDIGGLTSSQQLCFIKNAQATSRAGQRRPAQDKKSSICSSSGLVRFCQNLPSAICWLGRPVLASGWLSSVLVVPFALAHEEAGCPGCPHIPRSTSTYLLLKFQAALATNTSRHPFSNLVTSWQ